MIESTSSEKPVASSSQEKENAKHCKSVSTDATEIVKSKNTSKKIANSKANLKDSSTKEKKCLVNDSKSNCKKNLRKKSQLGKPLKRKKCDNSQSSPSIDALFKKIKKAKAEPVACIDLAGDSNDAKDLSHTASNSSEINNSTNSIDADSSLISSTSEVNEVSNPMEKSDSSIHNNSVQSTENPSEVLNQSLTHKKKLFKNLTPKQLAKQREVSERKEEKQKLKLQRELIKQSKQEEKQKLIEEREKLKEERERKKREENELREREKEEKKQKKEEERIKKEEERVKKEEEKQKKDEEKQKKEEEKLKKEEEKRLAEEEEKEKRQKAKAKFAQFFVTKKDTSPPQSQKEIISGAGGFMKFQVKENMRIAPLTRASLSDKRKTILDNTLKDVETKNELEMYIQILKGSSYIHGTNSSTYPPEDKSEQADDCEIIEEEEEEEFGMDENDVLVKIESTSNKTKVKAKLLQFCENRRPAYFGTWFKKSSVITGRKPFEKETHILDYEYDSDDDWEEEEVGESLSDSEGENEETPEEVDQYEVDNDFFVPHGYLSDDEGKDEEVEEEEELEEQEDEQKTKDLESQKEKLKQKQAEFELEMKEKKKTLKPKIYGCIWLGNKDCHHAYERLVKILATHQAINLSGSTFPLDIKAENNTESSLLKDNSEEPISTKKLGKNFPEEAVPDLIRMIHGNRHSKVFLTREFFEYWCAKNKKESNTEKSPENQPDDIIAKRKIVKKIKELGSYGKFTENGISLKRCTWFVSREIREKYGLADLSISNAWCYTIPPKEFPHDDKMEVDPLPTDSETEATPKPKSATSLITKFTKVLTEEEKEEERKRNLSSPAPIKPSNLNNSASITPQRINSSGVVSLITIDDDNVDKVESSSSTPKSSKKRSSSPPGNAKKKKRISFITLPKNEDGPSNILEQNGKQVSSTATKSDSAKKNKNIKISNFFTKTPENSSKAKEKGKRPDDTKNAERSESTPSEKACSNKPSSVQSSKPIENKSGQAEDVECVLLD